MRAYGTLRKQQVSHHVSEDSEDSDDLLERREMILYVRKKHFRRNNNSKINLSAIVPNLFIILIGVIALYLPYHYFNIVNSDSNNNFVNNCESSVIATQSTTTEDNLKVENANLDIRKSEFVKDTDKLVLVTRIIGNQESLPESFLNFLNKKSKEYNLNLLFISNENLLQENTKKIHHLLIPKRIATNRLNEDILQSDISHFLVQYEISTYSIVLLSVKYELELESMQFSMKDFKESFKPPMTCIFQVTQSYFNRDDFGVQFTNSNNIRSELNQIEQTFKTKEIT
ncbi:predicted protein [Naegleria gruberi]|uniref:Predicted protein n=1 Tax=Naegleria gruberi TaxID=5762 RepID=D2VBN9_NAEGR|nr:uncharacterized protein NAEGRDRAFT_66282 [Naegleria gruberi]EFC45941.1 predicted protein [Naegleria gruberi]|eukprot:XP_002678685.1 predicted protein [Naegleria gruberi strain NEG-M]